MNSQLIMLLTSWTVLLTAYVVLLIYRKQIEHSEDDTLHVMADSRVLTTQETIAHKMDVLDKWAKILITVVIVYGLIIAGIYCYHVWQTNINAMPV